MKNEKDMIKWLNDLKSDIGQQQHSQLWHYAEILDVVVKYLESTERTGEWVEVTNGRGGHECSECHSYAPSYASGDEHLSDYCPNCGADMRGDTE